MHGATIKTAMYRLLCYMFRHFPVTIRQFTSAPRSGYTCFPNCSCWKHSSLGRRISSPGYLISDVSWKFVPETSGNEYPMLRRHVPQKPDHCENLDTCIPFTSFALEPVSPYVSFDHKTMLRFGVMTTLLKISLVS